MLASTLVSIAACAACAVPRLDSGQPNLLIGAFVVTNFGLVGMHVPNQAGDTPSPLPRPLDRAPTSNPC
jgi:hypothetical protein